MASIAELDEAVRTARAAGCKQLVLLKCTSTYPASPENTNVRTIPHLRTLFGCEVGLSDHTMGVGVAVAAIALGATVVEKHFTLRRADGGVDSAFSLEPAELASLVVETERAWKSLGTVRYGATDAEKKSRAIFAASANRARSSSGVPRPPDEILWTCSSCCRPIACKYSFRKPSTTASSSGSPGLEPAIGVRYSQSWSARRRLTSLRAASMVPQAIAPPGECSAIRRM